MQRASARRCSGSHPPENLSSVKTDSGFLTTAHTQGSASPIRAKTARIGGPLHPRLSYAALWARGLVGEDTWPTRAFYRMADTATQELRYWQFSFSCSPIAAPVSPAEAGSRHSLIARERRAKARLYLMPEQLQ